ncbi:MAG: diguanylate cyclase, partial [Aliarcobacter sp.]
DFIMIDIFNKLLKTISLEKEEQILNKWTSINYEKSVDYQKIIFLSGIFIFIILIIYLKNRQINKINRQMKKYIKIVDENVLTSSTDIKGKINYVSKAFCEISGYTKDELIGQNHRIVRHEDMPKKLFQELWNTIKEGKIWQGEIKNKKKNGEFYWVKATISPIFDDNKKVIGYTAVREDITDKKRIEQISITDELTGLYNRRFFNEIFEREVNRAKRDEHPFALIIFDVDFFKLYNDNYGHQAGDFVLQSIGKKLKELCKRSSDFAFRIGGEEFAVIFTPHFKENAVEFANLINKEIENLQIEHEYNKASSYVTASVGLYTEIGENLDSTKDIYYCTDLALYEAKKNGRNSYIVFNQNLLKDKE